MKNKKSSPWKSLQVGFAVLLGLFVYAYGFDVTRVNLDELRSEKRQESLTRVTRTLAQPDIITYDQKEAIVNSPLYVPCPADGTINIPAANTSAEYLLITPACANPGETVQVEGFNFPPNITGPIRFIPGSDPLNIVALGRETIKTDGDGHFTTSFVLPNRISDAPQYIRVNISENVGAPRFTKNAKDTWDKIIETVFMALLATTAGTILAFPISFIAARNLMKPVRSPLTGISLSVLGLPVGMGLGYYIVNQIGALAIPLSKNILVNLISVVALPFVFWFAVRWALPQEEIKIPARSLRLARLFVLFVAILVAFFGLFQLSGLATNISLSIEKALGAFGFLASSLFQVSDILRITTPALGALAAGGALSSFLGRIGQRAAEKSPTGRVKTLNFILAPIAGATIFGLLGALVEWLYQIGRFEYTFWAPVIIGAGLGLALAALTKPKDTLPTGMVVYSITRTILNALRSVEALVMAIVFVIAVGIGPFAGMMALGLHTIVSLAKLYSEQVESIMAGPLEAITATGANRLQTIIYAVIPQVVPPYISYTMYRWDINVRMSTIIGFVGGGGIGFLLQQNINLLNYRQASTQMLAIAVVVASMDYLSSAMREKVV
ncbi:MAG: ABC transporter permease subunit [Anaerolineales bacterium]|nr:ABC transporter permease subunit [Anaerolineales bacterium]